MIKIYDLDLKINYLVKHYIKISLYYFEYELQYNKIKLHIIFCKINGYTKYYNKSKYLTLITAYEKDKDVLKKIEM